MSIGPVENAGLGPCELQDPVWAKMSALAAGVNKKRKKSETKPQAQINKCNNEKRRREQENIYIEELAELISANFADMSSLSVKPDKCAILQETVNQIRSIKQRESATQSSDPVQQGEVSSSRPNILSNEVYGPLLLEALEGFLFVVNAEGKVEHVTDNVSTYIKFTREEVLGKSIYNFIHHGDHARFSGSLLPMSIGWASESANRSRSFSIRLLVKPPDDQDESVEEKQTRVCSYELMQISSTQLRDQVTVAEEDGSDSGPCLLCVASRISHRDKATTNIQQFTTKLDTSARIIGVDVTGVSETYSNFISKDLMNRVFRDLIPTQEVHKFNAHLRDTLSSGQSTSAVYRLQIAQDKSIQVQTKSKLFKKHTDNDSDFVMATHSIIGENDAIGPSDPGGGNGSSGVGGPLMTSVVNGARNGVPVSSGSDSSTASSNHALLNTNTASFTNFNIDSDFNFDIFPSSTCWDLESSNWETRPDSRQSVTPVSTPTPRPPSNPSYSPATTVAQSPLANQFVTQPSPSVPNPATPTSYNFPFSPVTEQNYSLEEQKDTKANVLEEASSLMTDSNKLRNLLTKPPNSTDSVHDPESRNRNKILKGLLNQVDDDDNNKNDNRNSPRGLINRPPMPGSSELPKISSGGNDMLRKLLNDTSDDDDLETKAGMKKKGELLQILLKNENREDDDKKNDIQTQDDTLLRSLGFSSSPSPPNSEPARTRKRPSDDRDDNPTKRSSDGSQVSSSGPSTERSKLCEQNKMLASLLAKQPSTNQPIPPVPASVISAIPQEKLPRTPDSNHNKNMPNRMTMNQNLPSQHLINNNRNNASARMPGRPQTTTYLNTMLTSNNIQHQQRTENRQLNQVNSGCYTSPATSSTDNNNSWNDNNNMQASDPLLSDILDEVINFVPDNVINGMEGGDGSQASIGNCGLSEKMAINLIQSDLMQCESVVKSPSSPTISLPVTPPSYSTAMTTHNNQSGTLLPPPTYLQGTYIKRVQVRAGGPQYSGATITSPQQQLLQQQQRKLLQQEEQRRRLLQRQEQQHLLIPSNATDISGLQNIDSLLNNTVAPNVTLQRSSSVPESRLSPGYSGQLNQPNPRHNNQQPYSPHSQLTSPIGQQTGFPQTTVSNNYPPPAARLSPQTQQYNQQLSPRQAYPQGNAQNANWQQQSQARLSVQNPMLNAQLTGNYVSGGPNGRNFQRAPQQQQRTINSPGSVPTRHSPYPDQFPPPSSPNSANFNQSQYLRLQRTNSAPTATTQLPGGLGSPRPYGREHPPQPYPNIQPHLHPSHHPMMYQQDSSQYCYDQTGLQLPYNGSDRGRAPPHHQPGVSGSGPTSEFVRQELRAVVGARTAQAQPQPSINRNPLGSSSQLLNQQVSVSDLNALGLSFEMPSSGASESPKLWGAMGSDMGSMSPQPATSRSTMEEPRTGDHKASLLQKLLSE